MALSPPEWLAAISSTAARLSTYCFLRWIPGHHFPPIILTSIAVYIITIFTQSSTFGSARPTLKEAFPRLFGNEKQDEDEPRDRKDDDHEPIVYNDEKKVFKILLFGIPNWREPDYSYSTILINALLAILTLDLVFRGPLLHPAKDLRFSRVGYVDDTSAKVLFREPDPAQLPVYAYLKGTHESRWTTTDRIYFIDEDTDYTYPLTFSGLLPDTHYTYSLSNDLSGTFTTAPAPHSSRANNLVFLTSSCIKANFPYRPFSHSLAIHGFEHLAKVVRSLRSPASFMLFLGDFIYVDVPYRLSSSFRHYRSEYRRVYASPSWSLPGISAIPWIHTLDDHEIANDWSGGNDTAPFPAASDPFLHYHVSVNPPVPPSAPGEDNTTFFQFTRGPASFFMLDTRRYRTDPEDALEASSSSSSPKVTVPPGKPLYGSSGSPPNPPSSNYTMLGPAQLSSLLAFLSNPEPRGVYWKVIASSVPFTKNWRFGTSDTWGGFPSERAIILDAMQRAERDFGVRVVVLSGDRHEFAAIRFPPPVVTYNTSTSSTKSRARDSGVVYDRTPASGPHEFSVGPLSMFYLPFRTFKQVDEQDVAIQYLPDGNSKVGAIEIRNLGGQGSDQKSMLRYTLWIDGNVAWEYVLTAPSPGWKGEGRDGRFGLWS